MCVLHLFPQHYSITHRTSALQYNNEKQHATRRSQKSLTMRRPALFIVKLSTGHGIVLSTYLFI